MENSHTIGEKTTIPIRWLFVLVGACFTFLVSSLSVAVYVGSIDMRVAVNEAEIKQVSSDVSSLMKDIYLQQREIDRRLSRIEGKLGVK